MRFRRFVPEVGQDADNRVFSKNNHKIMHETLLGQKIKFKKYKRAIDLYR